jgi:FkbM family methyltransferase
MRRARALLRSALRSAASLPLAARGGLDRLDVEEFACRSKRALEALCRARAQPVYLGDNEALCRILGRYKLYVDARDKGLGAHLLLDGYWEMQLTMHIARHVRAGMTAIDVGANYGYYTLLLAALVGAEGRVLAIEPTPQTAAMLSRSIALNGFWQIVTVIEAAAGSGEPAQALLFVPDREPKNAQIVASPDGLDHIPGTLHRVAQSSVDTFAAEQRRVDFIKIDVEGAEEAVIAGMLATLRRDKPHLVLEFNAARARDPSALLTTLCTIYGPPRYLDLRGNVLEATPERLLRERFATDWLLVFGES